MTEQQEVQPSAAASVADNKQPGQKVNNKKSSSGAVVGGIAILLALGLTGGLYLHGHKSAVAQQGELNQLKLQLAEAMGKLDQNNSKDAEQFSALGKSQQQLQEALDAGPDGLTEADALQRREYYGANCLTPPKQRGPLLRFLLQFHNILLYIMLVSAVVTAALGHWIDSGVLFMAVIVNAIIGFIQEGKAESALNAIRAMLSPRATVIRAGQRREIGDQRQDRQRDDQGDGGDGPDAGDRRQDLVAPGEPGIGFDPGAQFPVDLRDLGVDVKAGSRED